MRSTRASVRSPLAMVSSMCLMGDFISAATGFGLGGSSLGDAPLRPTARAKSSTSKKITTTLPVSLFPNSSKPSITVRISYGNSTADEFVNIYGHILEDRFHELSTGSLEVE